MLTRRTIGIIATVGACLGFAATALAQPTIIRGVVRNTTGDPIPAATVTIIGGRLNQATTLETDAQGRFEMIAMRGGQWAFMADKAGYNPVQQVGNVRSSRINLVDFTLEPDPLNPPAPTRGHLAGWRATDIQAEIDAAHELFDQGDYDGAIAAYQATLARIPVLTTLNLQIGHAFRAKQDYERARAAYDAVPRESPAAAEAAAALQAMEGLAPAR